MKVLRKGEDLIDILTGDVSKIKSVIYYTHNMSKTNGITPNTKLVDGKMECRVASQNIITLTTGQLICEVELESGDTLFPDNKFNEIVKTNLPIWIQN